MTNTKKTTDKGFTLIEILVVIGIIAILAAVVLVAINPARQFAQANDSTRSSNVNTILNGIGQFIADERGTLPAGLPDAGDPAEDISEDLCNSIVPDFIPALPTDPTSAYDGVGITDCSALDDDVSGYTVVLDTEGRVTITAEADIDLDDDDDLDNDFISVTR